MSNEKVLKNCSFVKTALMLIIVFYHSIVFWGGGWFSVEPALRSPVFSVLAEWLNSFHIYAFVLVSGFLFYHLKFRENKYSKYPNFIINKAKRLIVPYVAVSAIWVIPLSSIFFKFDAATIVKKYIFGTSPSQLWFLLMLFWVFAIFWPLSKLFKNLTVAGAGIVLVLYGIGLVLSVSVPNVFQIPTALMYIPFFWIGFKLSQFKIDRMLKIPWFAWIIVDVALFVLRRYINQFDGRIFSLMSVCLAFLLHIAGALMAFFVLQKLANCIKWHNNKIISVFSKSAMPVYLLHQQIIYFAVYYLNGAITPYLHAPINFVLSLAVSTAIAVVLVKFKVTRFMIGEK